MQFSIVSFSKVKKNIDFRIDSDYQHPKYIKNSKLIRSNDTIRNFVKNNIKNIKSSPIGNGFQYLEISNISIRNGNYETVKVSEGEEPDRAHYILQKDDVVVSYILQNKLFYQVFD